MARKSLIHFANSWLLLDTPVFNSGKQKDWKRRKHSISHSHHHEFRSLPNKDGARISLVISDSATGSRVLGRTKPGSGTSVAGRYSPATTIRTSSEILPVAEGCTTRALSRDGRTLCRRSTLVLFLLRVFVLEWLTAGVLCQDQRCFLLQGGSVLNFFVRESQEVGSRIGELNIGGDASEVGDIYLRLDDPLSPVHIAPHSKHLILAEPLDKEGRTGASHVIVNVICQKRGASDLNTRIPINIRVTDDNDNSPVFSNAPYFVNVSEATVVGTVIVGNIKATDDDQRGPFSTVQYSIAKGPYSDFFEFRSPLSGELQLRRSLDYENDPLFNITIVAEDQGSPPRSTATFLTVQVHDSDDQNPAFRRKRYMALLPTSPARGQRMEVQPETIYAEDQDTGIRAPVYYSLGDDVKESSWFHIDRTSGEVFLTKDVSEKDLLQPIALSVMATQVDNKDRKDTTILTISRRGSYSSQLQFLQTHYDAMVPENSPSGSHVTQLLINKNSREGITYNMESGGYGVFQITDTGEVLILSPLDYETRREYSLKIFVTDGEYNDTATLRVQVVNVNDWDPRFQYVRYVFYVTKTYLAPGDVIGNVTVADGDGDLISLYVRGKDAKMFDITSEGDIIVKRIFDLNSTEANILLIAKDSGIPPRQSSVPVTIYFPEGVIRSLPLEMNSAFLLAMVLGSMLVVVVIIVICLVCYIHKNKKLRDDADAALPTKIISNHTTKLDPLSPLNHQLPNGSRAEGGNTSADHSTFRTAKGESGFGASAGGRGLSRNALTEEVFLERNVDRDSPSGTECSQGTTSTATGGQETGSRPPSPAGGQRFFPPKSNSVAPAGVSCSSSADGVARATGGLPTQRITPIPPVPPTSPTLSGYLEDLESPVGSPKIANGNLRLSMTSGPGNKKVVWPSAAVPRKVKKLSWEDELSGQTELDPEVSVTPLSRCNVQESPNLTVYF